MHKRSEFSQQPGTGTGIESAKQSSQLPRVDEFCTDAGKNAPCEWAASLKLVACRACRALCSCFPVRQMPFLGGPGRGTERTADALLCLDVYQKAKSEKQNTDAWPRQESRPPVRPQGQKRMYPGEGCRLQTCGDSWQSKRPRGQGSQPCTCHTLPITMRMCMSSFLFIGYLH